MCKTWKCQELTKSEGNVSEVSGEKNLVRKKTVKFAATAALTILLLLPVLNILLLITALQTCLWNMHLPS